MLLCFRVLFSIDKFLFLLNPLFDTYSRVVVKARKESKSATSHGIFVGAKVCRRPDGTSGNQDGM